MAPDRRRINWLANQSYSVLTRRQLTDLGVSVKWIRHQVDSGVWRRAYPGIYISHAGPVGWDTLVKAALLYVGDGAALSHSTAFTRWFQPPSVRDLDLSTLVEISAPASRRRAHQSNVRLHRRRAMPDVWPGILPTVDPAETVLDLLRRNDEPSDVVGLLTAAARTVRPGRLRDAVAQRPRVRHRRLVLEILADVDEGVESTLEFHHHHDVEQAHGLPRSELQLREKLGDSWIRADCRYRRYRTRVELDGRLAHPGGRTDRDTWRDNAVLLATDEITLRYRWSHVVGDPCGTARQVAAALRKGGWDGEPTRCGAECTL